MRGLNAALIIELREIHKLSNNEMNSCDCGGCGGGGEKFSCISGRIQGIGCALAWVTIARDSESEPPFYPWGNSTGFAQDTFGFRLAQA